MAKKKCPQCGKRISPYAKYCLFCMYRFDRSDTSRAKQESTVRLYPTEEIEQDVMPLQSIVTEANAHEVHTSNLPVEPVSHDIFEETDSYDYRDTKEEKNHRLFVVIVGVAVFVCIVAVLLWLLMFGNETSPSDQNDLSQNATSTSAPTETTSPLMNPESTISPERLALLRTFIGKTLVDEDSAGKKSIEEQGGAVLTIRSIENSIVYFDLYSYRGGETGEIASVEGARAKYNTETVGALTFTFSFDNDGYGHSGHGALHFRENSIDVEVVTNNAAPLPEDAHSLHIDSMFCERSLPSSLGKDISSVTSYPGMEVLVGKKPINKITEGDDDAFLTYDFGDGAYATIYKATGTLYSLEIDYTVCEDKSAYCYDSVDGTMTYETVKTYFGEADCDYNEEHKILVLKYKQDNNAYLQFTFGLEAILTPDIEAALENGENADVEDAVLESTLLVFEH